MRCDVNRGLGVQRSAKTKDDLLPLPVNNKEPETFLFALCPHGQEASVNKQNNTDARVSECFLGPPKLTRSSGMGGEVVQRGAEVVSRCGPTWTGTTKTKVSWE